MNRILPSAAVAAAMVLTPGEASAQDANDLAAELKAMREKIAALEAKVARMEAEQAIDAAQVQTAPAIPSAAAPSTQSAAAEAAPAPEWKGAPQFADRQEGFSFKPKGFFQVDTGWVENPGDAIDTTHLGYNTRARRIVLGAEGTLPGGFGYKAEFNFAGGEVGYEDIVLTYAPKGSALQITAGNFYPLSSLETMTSSRLTSFLERAQAVDAFGYNRRLGVSVGLVDDRYTLTAGLFDGGIDDGFDNDRWQASVRGTFSPTFGEGRRLHLGLNYQHRDGQSDAPSLRYRARPFTQLTDIRFVDTSGIPAAGDDVLGLELGSILGPLHFAGEAQQVWVDGPADARLRSAYLEAGYFLTGETRGYKGGRWDRAKVLNPVGKGGWGALQLNARLDMLDLSDEGIDGGRQIGYQLSAIWTPIDYVRFLLQYTRADVEGGPYALDAGDAYSVDSVALRTQVEF